MGRIKVAFWGLEFWGADIGKISVDKEQIEIIGAINSKAQQDSKEETELDYAESIELEIKEDVQPILKEADIVIISTNEGIHKVYEKIKIVMESKVNCIVISDEMTYPFIEQPELTSEIDKMAKVQGVTVLGMGINSSFALDTMIIALSSTCNKIEGIEARRINDISIYNKKIIRSLGVGLSIEEFEKEFNKGIIGGNVGLKQSLQLISRVLGVEIESIEESVDPIISNTFREDKGIRIEPGEVAGCNHIIHGFKENKAVIILEHVQEFCPKCEAIEIGDYIHIKGETELSLTLQPKKLSGIDIIAIALNMVLKVVLGQSGFKSMVDFPIFQEFKGEKSKDSIYVK